MLLSGMSTMVVTPPAAAARVAQAKPSHSVRPGLVDVHVRIHEARQDDGLAHVVDLAIRAWQRRIGDDSDDRSAC